MAELDPQQVAATLKELAGRQVRILTGTVTGYSSDPATTPVRLDNDSGGTAEAVPVVIPSICGTLPIDARVSILTVPPAGMMIVGQLGIEFDLTSRAAQKYWVIRKFYVADDIWVKPTNSLFLGVRVRLQAGGGGSGGTAACAAGQSSSSGGGQGGGFVEAYTLASLLAATAAIQVGIAGTAGAAGSNPGGAGGASFFDSGLGSTLLSVPGGGGGAGGGAGGLPATPTTVGQTTQAGGTSSQLAGLVVSNFFTTDFRAGDDGGTGWRTQAGDIGLVVPGLGGGSRMGAQTKLDGITTFGSVTSKQIAPIVGWPFGGGASGRGVNAYAGGGGVVAGPGAAGAAGAVVVEEIYRA